jgi:GNAT superfamily N-acetyltransferase
MIAYKVLFRDVTGHLPIFDMPEGVPEPYGKGWWSYVELHAPAGGIYGPIAWGIVRENENGSELLTLHVFEHFRKQGWGRALVEEAGERFEELRWTYLTSSLGFHEKLVEEGIAVREGHTFYYVRKGNRDVRQPNQPTDDIQELC